MSFLDAFNIVRYFEKKKFAGLSQEETEAFLDALVFAMNIDGEAHPDELKALQDAAEKLSWHGEDQVDEHIRNLETEVEAADAAKYVSDRIKTNWLLDDTYQVCARIAQADGEIVESETEFLAALAKAFGFSADHQRVLIGQMLNLDK